MKTEAPAKGWHITHRSLEYYKQKAALRRSIYTRFHLKSRSQKKNKNNPALRRALLISPFMLIIKIYVGEF